jgi:hypothetical protein
VRLGSVVRIGLGYRMGGRYEPDECSGTKARITRIEGNEYVLETDAGRELYVHRSRLQTSYVLHR